MARPPRFFVPGQPQHVVQRGNNRAPVFFSDGDCAFYLDCLRHAVDRYACDIHAYALMTNHVHLLVSPATPQSLPRAMQSVGRRYVGRINSRRDRTGTLWEARYRAAAIDSDRYFFTCSRYIELNPVRAGMVLHPAEYRWSSFAGNAGLRNDPLLRPHALYASLGMTLHECHAAYLRLFDQALDPDDVARLRDATHAGWPVGRVPFLDALRRKTGRRTQPLIRGRKAAPVAQIEIESESNCQIDSDSN